MKLNLLDILFIIFLLFWILKPAISGEFTSKVTKFLALLIGGYFTYNFALHPAVMDFISQYIAGHTTIKIVSTTLIFLTFYILTKIALNLLEEFIQIVPIPFFDSLVATLVSLCAGIIFLLLIFFVLNKSQIAQTQLWRTSLFVKTAQTWNSQYKLENKAEKTNQQPKTKHKKTI